RWSRWHCASRWCRRYGSPYRCACARFQCAGDQSIVTAKVPTNFTYPCRLTNPSRKNFGFDCRNVHNPRGLTLNFPQIREGEDLMSDKRALVVDDSKSARAFLARILERHEIAVDAADSAEAAIEYLTRNKPDVIFMDHMMPGMDGF